MSQQIGKYELVRKIAIGGMAEVFLAKAAGPMGFEKTLVVKRILPHLADDPKFVEMFLFEAKLAAQLNHPNVVQIFDFGEAEGAHFLAMEYVDGPNLRALIRRAQELERPLDPPVAAKIVSLACEGLAYAHEFQDPTTGQSLGLIHRDVSPDNILVSANGAVKVVDFGIAKAAKKDQRTSTGVLKGKLAYMPPEQLRSLPLDLRADVFALGMVLYELLTGARPFDAENEIGIMQAIIHDPFVPVTERRPDTPQALREIVDRALEKDRERRYPGCREMQADLERYIVSTGNPVAGYQLAQLVTALSAPQAGNLPSPSPRQVRTPIGQAQAWATPLPRTAAEVEQPPEPEIPTSPRPAPRAVPPLRVTDPHLRPPPQVQRGQPTSPVLLGALAVVAAGGLLFLALSSAGPEATPPPSPPPPAPSAALPPPEPPPEEPPPPAMAESAPAEPAEPAEEAEEAPPPRPAEPGPPRPQRPRVAAGARPPAVPNPALASLVVESVPPAQVRVNGRVYGRSPATVHNLPPGDVKIEVFDPRGAFSKAVTDSLLPGKTLTRRLILGKGKVEFRVRPYATVYLDGKLLGQTPFDRVEVWEGTHSVRLVNRDLKKEAMVKLTVRAGEDKVFGYKLDD